MFPTSPGVISVNGHNGPRLAVARTFLKRLKNGAAVAVHHQRHRRTGRQRLARRAGIGPACAAQHISNPFLQRPARSIAPLTGVRTEEIYKNLAGWSRPHGMMVQAQQAIVGANFLRMNRALHQDGRAKNRLTYEIIDAADSA